MPVMDGFEATRRLREMPALASVPIVALSASAFEATRAQCEEAGASHFLAKPVKLEELLALLQQCLQLQWQQQAASHGQYRESASHAGANDRAPAPCLPQQFARELYDLALSGDVLGLTGRLASFEESESLPVPIVAELRTLARNFDMKSIRTVLRPIAKA